MVSPAGFRESGPGDAWALISDLRPVKAFVSTQFVVLCYHSSPKEHTLPAPTQVLLLKRLSAAFTELMLYPNCSFSQNGFDLCSLLPIPPLDTSKPQEGRHEALNFSGNPQSNHKGPVSGRPTSGLVLVV